MTISKILCFNLILILSVHGQEVVARIRFQSSHYTVSEDSPEICIPVENTAAPSSQDFAVSFSFDPILIGSQGELPFSGPRQGTIRFTAGSTTSDLCITHFDNDVVCEPDITGQVRLINSSAVRVIEPSTARVTIKDNDPAFIGFKSASHAYSEGELDAMYPVLQSSHPSLPITLQISEAQHSTVLVSPSLAVPDTLFSVSGVEEVFQLTLIDDDVALEAPEAIVLALSVFSQTSCSELELTPFNQTQITIYDNDDVTVGLEQRELIVRESDRSVEVCVRLSTRIARVLAFRISTRNGTAKSGEDYTRRIVTGQFMPLSEQLRLCYEIAVTFDSVIEHTESFFVDFSLETSLPNEVRRRINMENTVTNIVIEDSSSCHRTVLDGRSGREMQYFVPKSSTVCFDCAAYEQEVKSAQASYVLWLVGSQQFLNNDHFVNGHVLSNGTMLITNSSKSFELNSVTTIGCANNLDDPTASIGQQPVVNFDILIGASPKVVSLVSSEQPSSNSATIPPPQKLTCLYEGVPEPEVEWLLNNEPVKSSFFSEQLAVPEEKNRYKSVLTLPDDSAEGTATYTCVCKNPFGDAQRSITFREKAVTVGIVNKSKALKASTGLFIFLLFSAFCLLL